MKDVWIDLFLALACFGMMLLNLRDQRVFFQATILCLLLVAGIFWKMHRQNQRVARWRAQEAAKKAQP